MLSGLSRVHLYPKTPHDLTVSTRVGGGISIVAIIVMALLFLTELSEYVSTRFETSLEIDDNSDQKLLISFQLALPHVPCHVIAVSASDVLGTRTTSSASNVFKHKLDAAGNLGPLVGGAVSAGAQHLTGPGSSRAFGQPAVPLAGGADDDEPLEPGDFDSAVESYDLVLVNFFAPWCPHCIQFAPIWREAAQLLDESEYADQVLLTKLDCNVHSTFCADRHSIDRFPTVRAYANAGADMVTYTGEMTAQGIVRYVDRVMQTRREVALEEEHGAPKTLSFAQNESVQVWFHNGWRDARITGRVQGAEAELREYRVRFVDFTPPEGAVRSNAQMLVIFGGLIQVSQSEEQLDHQEHEVSVHILRPKTQHPYPYKVHDKVQLRVSSGWVSTEVLDTREVADDQGSNCTEWEASGQCASNAAYMLLHCAKTCHASSHPLEYRVKSDLSSRWVTHERLLAEGSGLHVSSHSHGGPVEGCQLSGQLMVSRVPGTLLVQIDGHAHSFNVKAVNLSHTVEHLSFGHSDGRNEFGHQALPQSVVHARTTLDHTHFSSQHTHESHVHYLKVIRTTVRLLRGEKTDMISYTASSATLAHLHTGPSIAFTYDLSPLHVIIDEETEGLFRFLVYIFAILGGGFTVFGLFDSVLFHGDRLLRQKISVGKVA